jgi:hypothetical protein
MTAAVLSKAGFHERLGCEGLDVTDVGGPVSSFSNCCTENSEKGVIIHSRFWSVAFSSWVQPISASLFRSSGGRTRPLATIPFSKSSLNTKELEPMSVGINETEIGAYLKGLR